MKKYVCIAVLPLCFILLATVSSWALPFIYGPYRSMENNNIIVSFAVGNPGELESSIRSGVEKEIIYTIELLRVWDFWPDEFVVSKRVIRQVKYDNLRDHYQITFMEGTNPSERIIKTESELKKWIFSVEDINLVNVKELSSGRYYIRAIVETRSIEQLPVIGFVMHFIPESEMTLAKESELFNIEVSLEKP